MSGAVPIASGEFRHVPEGVPSGVPVVPVGAEAAGLPSPYAERTADLRALSGPQQYPYQESTAVHPGGGVAPGDTAFPSESGSSMIHMSAGHGTVGIGGLASPDTLLTIHGDARAEGTITAQLFRVPACDFAEFETVAAGCPDHPMPASIVGFDERGMVTTLFDRARTFGVVSVRPGILGGVQVPGSPTVAVAYAGKTPLLIPGACAPGDLVYPKRSPNGGRIVPVTAPPTAAAPGSSRPVGAVRAILGTSSTDTYVMVVVAAF